MQESDNSFEELCAGKTNGRQWKDDHERSVEHAEENAPVPEGAQQSLLCFVNYIQV